MGYVTAVRILDEESLQACAAYVDLNPERAVLAETLEASDYTSVQHRITSLKENRRKERPIVFPAKSQGKALQRQRFSRWTHEPCQPHEPRK